MNVFQDRSKPCTSCKWSKEVITLDCFHPKAPFDGTNYTMCSVVRIVYCNGAWFEQRPPSQKQPTFWEKLFSTLAEYLK